MLAHHGRGVVRRAVVDDDHFEIGVVAREDAADRSARSPLPRCRPGSAPTAAAAAGHRRRRRAALDAPVAQCEAAQEQQPRTPSAMAAKNSVVIKWPSQPSVRKHGRSTKCRASRAAPAAWPGACVRPASSTPARSCSPARAAYRSAPASAATVADRSPPESCSSMTLPAGLRDWDR